MSLRPALASICLSLCALPGQMARGEDCKSTLQVLGASATYKLSLFKGKPVRRDGVVEVELSSTSTAPIAWVELGIFLGASLKAVTETRPQALPTARPRALEDGGLAFRAEVPALIRPGTTRKLVVEKQALPMDQDFSSVAAVVSDCRAAVAVGEEAQVAPAEEALRWSRPLVLAAMGGALALLVALLLRLR